MNILHLVMLEDSDGNRQMIMPEDAAKEIRREAITNNCGLMRMWIHGDYVCIDAGRVTFKMLIEDFNMAFPEKEIR